MSINTKLGQTKLEKWDSHAAMVRLVRELAAKLEDSELIDNSDLTRIDNVIYGFLSNLPAKVGNEVTEG